MEIFGTHLNFNHCTVELNETRTNKSFKEEKWLKFDFLIIQNVLEFKIIDVRVSFNSTVVEQKRGNSPKRTLWGLLASFGVF